jgi:hypothetical protein
MIEHFRFDKGGISRKPSRHYLAYGSNLDMERMGHRCPYAVPVGVTEIYGYRLLFKKSKTGCYATIEQDANESVPAVVWLLSEFDELLLDRYEGCPRYYYKKQFQLPVWNLDGHRMKKLKTCMAYILHEERQPPAMSTSSCWQTGIRSGDFRQIHCTVGCLPASERRQRWSSSKKSNEYNFADPVRKSLCRI